MRNNNYPIGMKIRRIREWKGIPLESFAKQLKIEEKKLRKIENGDIEPKTPLLNRISKLLNVDTRVFSSPDINDPIGVLYLLFDLERLYGLNIDTKDGKLILSFEDGDCGQINGYLKKWRRIKACVNKKISENEYEEWKLNFPYYDFLDK